jgi:hypothetical protein
MTIVRSVQEFLSAVRSEVPISAHGRLAVYRGQRDASWPLLPGIARSPFNGANAICFNPDNGSSDKTAERRLLIVLRDYGVTHFPQWVWHGSPAEVRWKQIVVAQHYGLPTRLLDWTANPLVALFFSVDGQSATCSREDCQYCSRGYAHPSSVVALKGRDTFSVSSLANSNRRPPLYEGPKIPGLIRPPEIDGRITAQSSIFSIATDPLVPIAPDFSLEILSENRRAILKELDELGVNHRTLFPDLQGLARYLAWHVQFWEPNPGVDQN